MKRRILFLLAAVFLTFTCVYALAGYSALSKGDSGQAVLALKRRMYELGYFSSDNFSDTYNETTAERIRRLQKMNGIKEDGVASEELQTLIFSDEVLAANGTRAGETASPSALSPEPKITNTPKPTRTPKQTNTPKPTRTPKPTVAPITEPEMPQTDENGFLTSGEFVFEDVKDGHWLYLSQTLRVEIKRYSDPNLPLVWFETQVYTAPSERMRAILTGGKYFTPQSIAEKEKAVLAFSDDFYGYRVRNKIAPGIIVRNGEIISDKTKKETTGGFPKLETLAYFADGSMKCFGAREYTAQEYIDKGATDVLAFGPVLVTNGALGEKMTDDTYYHYREPRCALGMVEPNHYIVLTVVGRSDDSKGAYLSWLGEKMLALGAKEALNLDGGGTAALIFMGRTINAKTQSTRKVTSILAFGTTQGSAD